MGLESGEIVASRKMGTRGRLQIPREVRDLLKLETGVLVLFLKDAHENIFLRKAPTLKRERVGKYE